MSQRRSRLASSLVAIIAILFTAGCGSSSATSAPAQGAPQTAAPGTANAPGRVYKIGVSQNGLANLHNLIQWTETTAYLKTLGQTAVMVNAGTSAAQQVTDIQNLIQQKVDALIVMNGDTAMLTPVIAQAAAAGIPIVSEEAGTVPGASVVVGANEFVIGATIAAYLANQVGDTGKVATVYHNDNHAIRTRGAEIEAVLKEFGMQSVGHVQSIWPGTTENALTGMQSILIAHPDIVAVFCSQDLEAIGVSQAIEQAGLKGKIITIGVDGELQSLQSIAAGGPQIATVVEDIKGEADEAVDAAVKLAGGQQPTSKVLDVPFTLVTKDNVGPFLQAALNAAKATPNPSTP